MRVRWLCVAMLLSVAACSKGEPSAPATPKKTEAPSTKPAPGPEAAPSADEGSEAAEPKAAEPVAPPAEKAPPEAPAPAPAEAPPEAAPDCGGADWVACLGSALKKEKAGEFSEQLRLLREVCDGKPKTGSGGKLTSMEGCVAGGRLLLEGADGVTKDATGAATLYQRACDNGHVDGCEIAGLYWGLGKFGAVDMAKAAGFLQKACDGGKADACAKAAQAKKKAALGSPDTWAEKCDGGAAEACLELGLALERGTGGHSADPKLAAKRYQQACKAKLGVACSRLGALYDTGAIKGGFRKAGKAYDSACTHGDGAACYTLGQRAKVGSKRHVGLLERGCELKEAQACFAMGVLHKGDFVKGASKETAREWFKKACALGYKAGCGHAR